MENPKDAATGVVSDVVHGLAANPACLAAVALAALMAILTYFALRDDKVQTQATFARLIENCGPGAREFGRSRGVVLPGELPKPAPNPAASLGGAR